MLDIFISYLFETFLIQYLDSTTFISSGSLRKHRTKRKPAEGKVSDEGHGKEGKYSERGEEKGGRKEDAPGTAWRVGYYVPVRRGIP